MGNLIRSEGSLDIGKQSLSMYVCMYVCIIVSMYVCSQVAQSVSKWTKVNTSEHKGTQANPSEYNMHNIHNMHNMHNMHSICTKYHCIWPKYHWICLKYHRIWPKCRIYWSVFTTALAHRQVMVMAASWKYKRNHVCHRYYWGAMGLRRVGPHSFLKGTVYSEWIRLQIRDNILHNTNTF